MASRWRSKKSDLLPRDYVYRGTRVWSPKLREKMETGAYLSLADSEAPFADNLEPPTSDAAAESVENGTQTAAAQESGKPPKR